MRVLTIRFTSPRLVTCRCCKGTSQGFGTLRCDCCNGDGCYEVDDPSLATLAHNLAVAGGLCASFNLGCRYADDLWDVDAHSRRWRPGCRRPAP